MTSGVANDIFSYGSHGSTYGGTPLACRVVDEVINVILEEDLLTTVEKNSQFLTQTFLDELASYDVTIRGKGMMLGVVLPEKLAIDFSQLVDISRDKFHIIVNVTGGNVIRLLPPLNMSLAETEQVAEKVIALVKSVI